MQTLLNWCRIRKDYPELNTIRETKFVLPDKQKKRDKNDYEIRAKMSKNKAKIFGESENFRNFAVPKLEQNAPNQLSFNELGKL